MMPDKVEYHLPGEVRKGRVLAVESSIVPRKGETVSIAGETYVVSFVSYALDQSESFSGRQNCACIQLSRVVED